jgi:WD40 repeat protein
VSPSMFAPTGREYSIADTDTGRPVAPTTARSRRRQISEPATSGTVAAQPRLHRPPTSLLRNWTFDPGNLWARLASSAAVESQVPIWVLAGHRAGVWAVGCSPDGTRIVSGSGDKTLKIWDAGTGAELVTLTGHTAPVYAVAYSWDGTRIVSGSWDETLRIWDAASGKRLATLKGHKNGVNAVAYSPDGTRIVSGSWDKTLRIWDAASGKRLATLKGHKDGVNAVACSPDGTRIVSGSGTHWEHQFHPEDEALWVWEASSVTHVASLTGHRNVVRAVTYSPDGSRIASGSDDWTVRVWDAASGAELAAFLGHSDGVRAVAYSRMAPASCPAQTTRPSRSGTPPHSRSRTRSAMPPPVWSSPASAAIQTACTPSPIPQTEPASSPRLVTTP